MKGLIYLTRDKALSLFNFFKLKTGVNITVGYIQWVKDFLSKGNVEYSVLDNFGDFILRNNIQIID